MCFVGMDVEDVENIINQIHGRASAIETLVEVVDGVVGTLLGDLWGGDDALEFHGWWNGTHRPAAVVAQTRLETMVTELRTQLQAQTGVSGLDQAFSSAAERSLRIKLAAQPPILSTSPRSKAWVAALADLSNAAEGHQKPPPGFVEVTKGHGSDGLDYVVYEYMKADGTYGYVCAFAGTAGLRDWEDNAIDSSGAQDPQYLDAIALAQRITHDRGAGNVTFTGHSLGGGLAAVSSIATGSPAITFNAAAPGDGDVAAAAAAGGHQVTHGPLAPVMKVLDSIPGGGPVIAPHTVGLPATVTNQVTDFMAPDDPLSDGEHHAAIGHHVTLQGSDSSIEPITVHQTALGPIASPPSPFYGHGLEHMAKDITSDESGYWQENA